MKQDGCPTFIDRCLLRLSVKRKVDGLWLGVLNFGEPDVVLESIEDGLALIKARDPLRYGRIQRDLDGVWARLLPGCLGNFNASIRACELDRNFILENASSSAMIAAVIVHEATHARLDRYGFTYAEKLRSRIEAICLRREIAFAAKLLDGKQVREHAEATLVMCMTEDYWTDVAFDERNIQAGRDLGVPERVVRIILGIRALVLRVKKFAGA